MAVDVEGEGPTRDEESSSPDNVWSRVEQHVGGTVPAQIKRAVAGHGGTQFLGMINVLTGRPSPAFDDVDLEHYLELAASALATADQHDWVEPPGRDERWVVWATSDNGELLLALWIDGSSTIRTGVVDPRSDAWESHAVDPSAFLVGIADGSLSPAFLDGVFE